MYYFRSQAISCVRFSNNARLQSIDTYKLISLCSPSSNALFSFEVNSLHLDDTHICIDVAEDRQMIITYEWLMRDS